MSKLRLIDTDLEPTSQPEQRTFSRNRLVNTLNLCNFRNETVRIHFRHKDDDRRLYVDVHPQPCFNKYLVCLWPKHTNFHDRLPEYHFSGLSISREAELISADCRLRAVTKKGLCVTLPDHATSQCSRKAIRHKCRPTEVQLLQNGVFFSGIIKDFSAFAFRVELFSTENAPIQWLNVNNRITLLIRVDQETIYSGECRIIKQDEQSHRKFLVMAPVNDAIQRFTPRLYRSKRVTLSPAPDIVFTHPLTGGMVSLKVIDISGSGISVEDDTETATLIAGMIIPEMSINLANTFQIRCKAQVLYRRICEMDTSAKHIRCGIVFLDMLPNDHMRLLSLIHQAENPHLYICNTVDIEELWNFFFETGFLYPKKYAFIQPVKEQVKETYEKLYTKHSSISRHFTWQRNGSILAHLAMLRFYENTWLIHHLAARTDKRLGSGVDMVDQISAFTYDTHRLASAHMSYLMCYYRPANKFPDHFFGGVAKNINNLQACSIDNFAYFHSRIRSRKGSLPEGWSLIRAEYEDMKELEQFYAQSSGGLMLKCLDLIPEKEMHVRRELCDAYQEMGLRRERRVFVLKQGSHVKAVIMANISDFALNLSDLTNCINLFVIDQKTPYGILQQCIYILGELYENAKIPVLIFPKTYAEDQGVKVDRVYALWVLDGQYSDDFTKNYNYLK